MKKIFAFLLSVGLLMGQMTTSKVSAEPTEFCRNLIFYLDYDSIMHDIAPFSIEQLQNEINNYNENDFDKNNRVFANYAMRAYQEALNVINGALERTLPDSVLEAIVPDQNLSDSSAYLNQVNTSCEYLFRDLNDGTRSLCWESRSFNKDFVYSQDFYNENKELFTRFLSILHEADDGGYGCFDEEEIYKVLVFLARGFFKGYSNEARFFRMSIKDSEVIHFDLMVYDGDEIRSIDSFAWGL